MSKLMGHDGLVFTSVSNEQPSLTTSYFTDLAPPTVEKTVRSLDIALNVGCRKKFNYHSCQSCYRKQEPITNDTGFND